MAFHQPTRQAAQRVFRPSPQDDESHHTPQPASQAVEDSQTWVLFSPATDAGTTTSYLTSTHKTNTTPGRSRLSDLGSLHSLARSEASAEPRRSTSFIDALDEDDEDDAELDSLDSHLPEFRSTPDFYNSSQAVPHATPVVPAHDGLGSFRLEQEGMGADVQNRLYAFEQYNPRRVKRRRESLDLAQAELENEGYQEIDKTRWIESWRLEQSRYLLEEVQRETRRRRRSAASTSIAPQAEKRAEDVATLSAVGGAVGDTEDQGEDWHDHNENESRGDHESVWGRITRKVVRDLLGIDDKLLSILFGEALPDEEDLSSTPKASVLSRSPLHNVPAENTSDSGWQLKMLERVAKELGLLVHQLSEHPGAFSTFSRVQQMPLPYAGLSPIPESANDPARSAMKEAPAIIPEFKPTIATQTRPIDVPQARHPSGSAPSKSQVPAENTAATFTQDEWEQDLDVRLIFRYLRSRFLSRPSSTGVSGNSHLATFSTQDTATCGESQVQGDYGFQPGVSPACFQLREPEHAQISQEKQLLLVSSLLGYRWFCRNWLNDCYDGSNGELG
ncbi:Uu.00g106590.m01.CDS01 [Anthostomella pinea]|uniref:Uu.00g106590.m01.CDS01 n=1 Tax=Anthostomella pinea TaxID=933095 RepID=A0AAI8VE88_9PEZI|nr:Uu.00g106590.m01.CDS01 [Anthostomella pinea]